MEEINEYLGKTTEVLAKEVKENETYKHKTITYFVFCLISTLIISFLSLVVVNITCMYLSFNFEKDFVFEAVFLPSTIAVVLFAFSQLFYSIRNYDKNLRVKND